MLRKFDQLFSIAKSIKKGEEFNPYDDGIKNPYIRVFNYWQDALLRDEEDLYIDECNKIIDALSILYENFCERNKEFKETVIFYYE